MAKFGNIGIDSGANTVKNFNGDRFYSCGAYDGFLCNANGTITSLKMDVGVSITVSEVRLGLYELQGEDWVLLAQTSPIEWVDSSVISGAVSASVVSGNSYIIASLGDGTGVVNCISGNDLTYGSQTYGSLPSPGNFLDNYDDAKWPLIWAEGSGSSAATLSAATPSGTLGTSTTATVGATTDQNTGTFYAVIGTGSQLTGVTASQIKAGQQASGSAALASNNSAVSTTSPSTGVTGLTASTAYTYAAIQNNTNGDSNIVTGTFTTAAASAAARGLLTTGVG